MLQVAPSFCARHLFRFIPTLVGLAVMALAGCGGGGNSAPAPIPADPTGYYNVGGATIKDPDNPANDLVVTDLQAMVHNNRMMIMSNSNALMYDASITSINGNDFSADVVIYHGMDIGILETPPAVINTTLQGTITEGSQINAIVAGSDIGSGTISVTYSPSNANTADLANVAKLWTGPINTLTQIVTFEFEIFGTGDIEVDFGDSPSVGMFAGCEMMGQVTPVTDTSLFTLDLNVTVNTCHRTTGGREGPHTGLITTRDSNHDTLVVMFNNGSVSGMAEWTIVP